MTWFLQMHGPPVDKLTTALLEGVDIDELSQQLCDAQDGEYVRIPARMDDQLREAPLYLRVRDWPGFRLFHHDPEVVE